MCCCSLFRHKLFPKSVSKKWSLVEEEEELEELEEAWACAKPSQWCKVQIGVAARDNHEHCLQDLNVNYLYLYEDHRYIVRVLSGINLGT